MRRSPVPVAVVTLAVLMIGLLAYGLIASGSSTNLDTAVQRGERPAAPVATLELQNLGRSGTTSLSDLRGSIVVVNIWGSWCAPCEAEAPILSAMHRALERTGEGQVLGVTRVDASSRSLEKVREWGLPYRASAMWTTSSTTPSAAPAPGDLHPRSAGPRGGDGPPADRR